MPLMQIIDIIESLPRGSCAPVIIKLIYEMPDLSLEGKRVLSKVFLNSYLAMLEVDWDKAHADKEAE